MATSTPIYSSPAVPASLSTLTFREEGEVVVVDIAGAITGGRTSSDLRELLRELAVAGYRNVLLNMLSVTALDSAGLGEIIAGYTSLVCVDGDLKLVGTPKTVAAVISTARLDSVFEMYAEETEAILSFYVTKSRYVNEILRSGNWSTTAY